ncbi:MAG: Cys-tRNA(Pro) deacylase [Lachnospiraceae bacterium]|nr:Cys-tRNA(Pro) deacylase [Lachnospiraceae bacterium]
MKKEEKTNVMRVLDGKKVSYESHSYNPDPTMSGEEIAGILGEDPSKVFKTLVTQGKSGQYYVFVVPVKSELDLKKAAKASGEKAVSMIKQKELLPLTGYVHGGCSPIGMKKQLPTFIHETAKMHDKIFVSAGKVGIQIELAPNDLIGITGCKTADIISFTKNDIISVKI